MKKHFLNRLFCVSLSACLLGGCAAPPKAEPVRYTYTAWDVFDTVTTAVGYADSEQEWNAQMDAFHEDLLYYHKLFDIYNTYDGINNLYTVNQNAGVAPVTVDEPILELLELSREMYTVTNGQMNAAGGSVLALWHDARTAGLDDPDHAALPPEDALQAAAGHCDWSNVILDEDAGTVYLADPEMSLDVGSVGKGYATELAAHAAEERGLTSAMFSVGGNIRAVGQKPDGSAWAGGIQDPWTTTETQSGGSLYAVNVSGSLVVSGDYQRYYTVDGVRYNHLIDFSTLYPATYYRSVSVLCQDSGRADCLSTGLFCLPLAEGRALVESLDGVEALWLLPDKTAVMSSGFEGKLRTE